MFFFYEFRFFFVILCMEVIDFNKNILVRDFVREEMLDKIGI